MMSGPDEFERERDRELAAAAYEADLEGSR